jgi:hypothetical protein
MIRKFAILTVVSMLYSPVSAENNAPALTDVDALRQQGYSVSTIIPIFGQLMMFSLPKAFAPVFEHGITLEKMLVSLVEHYG